MSIANLHETLLAYTMRKDALNLELSQLASQKTLAIRAQSDEQSLLSANKHEIRDYFKKLYESDPELQEKYKDYTQIAEFEEQIDKITAEFQEKIEELSNWEVTIDERITTGSAEMEEINAYMESLKSMLSNNISSDFNLKLD